MKSLFKKSSPAAKGLFINLVHFLNLVWSFTGLFFADFSSVPYLEDVLEGNVATGVVLKASGPTAGCASDAFVEFLKTLSKPMAVDISRHINSFAARMVAMCDAGASVDELSETTKVFYQTLGDRFKNHPTFGGEERKYMLLNRKSVVLANF